MKISVLALAGAFLVSPSIAFSQNSGATSPETPVVSTPDSNNPDAPVKGANSFTEEQAKSRIEEAGYKDVSNLKLRDDGVWEASAMKGTETLNVQLDYQGNVSEKAM